MVILILHFGSRKTPKIKDCVLACGQQAEIVAWDADWGRPVQLHGVIFSGSPTYLTQADHAPYHKKIAPVLDWQVPVLGICFGHQLLGVLHGAKIYRGEEVARSERIMVLQENILLHGLGNAFEMAEDHTEGIDVPEHFIHLARSSSYNNEAMRHREKPFWGVQFHPEVSGENGMVVFRNFMEICGLR